MRGITRQSHCGLVLNRERGRKVGREGDGASLPDTLYRSSSITSTRLTQGGGMEGTRKEGREGGKEEGREGYSI